jgi:2-polyprenyl-3-methyl-5-hydroxy-6-metoxy-1,4-benzoquinol methylase
MSDPMDREGNETRTIHALVDFRGKDVLEIGCGNGRMTWRYADLAATVVALDPFADDIERARANIPDHLRTKVQFQCADVVTTDMAPGSFDVVVFSRSI